jgi:hypothetical protein
MVLASPGSGGSNPWLVQRSPVLLLVLKALVCAFVAARTGVPGRDGVSYLWMAQEAAAGRPESLFATVFHPLYPAMVGALLRAIPGLEVELAGQLVACSCATLAILPLWGTARALFGERAAWWTGLCYVVGAWFARHPAECLSEGPFFLLVTLWTFALTRARPQAFVAGAAAALAYLCRPEGAALIVLGSLWLWCRRERARTMELLLGALPLAALLPAGYAMFGDGFTLTPKAAFNWSVGAGSAGHGGFARVLAEAANLPWAAFEEIGFMVLPLVIGGLFLQRPRQWRDPRWLLLAPFLVQCCAVILVRSHYRFLGGFGILLLPFAGVAADALWQALQRKHRLLPWLLPSLLLASEARVCRRNPEREVEREIGRFLGERLAPGETVASDMPLLVFYAGRRPPEPKPISASELLAAAARPECRFVAVVAGRTDLPPDRLAELGLEPLELPALLSGLAGRRGVQVWANKQHR